MIKCPICDLNYIDDGVEACAVCRPPLIQPVTRRGRTAAVRPPKVQNGGGRRGRGEITEQMVSACYEYAKQFHAGSIHITDAVSRVVTETGMNEASAQRMIYDSIGGLFAGTIYKSIMSKAATIWIMEAIKDEFGEDKYQTAIKAVEQHLDYKEHHGIRKYINRHRK